MRECYEARDVVSTPISTGRSYSRHLLEFVSSNLRLGTIPAKTYNAAKDGRGSANLTEIFLLRAR